MLKLLFKKYKYWFRHSEALETVIILKFIRNGVFSPFNDYGFISINKVIGMQTVKTLSSPEFSLDNFRRMLHPAYPFIEWIAPFLPFSWKRMPFYNICFCIEYVIFFNLKVPLEIENVPLKISRVLFLFSAPCPFLSPFEWETLAKPISFSSFNDI